MSPQPGSNQRPTDYKSVALSAELWRHYIKKSENPKKDSLVENLLRAPSQDQIAGATPQRPTDYKHQAFLAVALSAELWRHYIIKFWCYPKEIISLIFSIRASSRDQTSDLLITSQLLYQLSYGGVPFFSWCKSSVFNNTTLLFSKKF